MYQYVLVGVKIRLFFRAIKKNASISCIWKLMADSCFLIAKLPKRYSHAFVLKALAEGKDVDGIQQLLKEELYSLAARYLLTKIQNQISWK